MASTATGGSGKSSGPPRYTTGMGGHVDRGVSFEGADADTLKTAIHRCVEAGDCIMFSRTADGGALHIRVLTKGEVAKWYPVSSMELHDVLSDVIASNTSPGASRA
jgi:hypothetical protein